MITARHINEAYDDLSRATRAVAAVTDQEAARRAALETKKAELLAMGTIDGKNAEVREAQLRDRLATEYAELADVQSNVAGARTNLAVCQIEVERCKTLLKLLEVTP